jgi:hypothetical protein
MHTGHVANIDARHAIDSSQFELCLALVVNKKRSPMKTSILAAVAVVMLATPALAAGGHCDADMAAIKAAMSKAKLGEADMKTVNDALAKAAEMDKAGKEEDCEKSLAGASKLVGVQEQHKN